MHSTRGKDHQLMQVSLKSKAKYTVKKVKRKILFRFNVHMKIFRSTINRQTHLEP
jgi:hypothetical protein